MKKNLLITGSGGFVGKNLKDFFAKNFDFNLYTPRSFELNCLDSLKVKQYLEQNEIDYIIHCASVGGVRGVLDNDTTVEDNLKMVQNLLDSKKENARLILFGSGAMYGKSRELKKISEDCIGQYIPEDLYGNSKMLIANLIKNRKDCVCLNIFGCYGRWEKESRFPTYAITKNIKNEPIEINQNVIFDYLYIDDLTKIVEYFLFNIPQNNIINVTPNDSISLLDIANIINTIGNNKVPIYIKNDILGNEYTGDNTRLLKEIEDFEFTQYNNGLKNLYEYILNQKLSI